MEEQVIIDVQFDAEKTINRLVEVNDKLDEMKSRQNKLREAIKNTTGATTFMTDELARNEKEISALKGEQKSLIGVLQVNEKTNASLGDSYNEISARMVQLQKEYKSLSAEQRNSEGGKAILKQIAEQKQALKDMDATMGDYQRNVGNYAGSISPYFTALTDKLGSFGKFAQQGFSMFSSGIASAGTATKAFGATMMATPLGWFSAALNVIVALFDKLKTAFAKNDEAGTNMARMLSTFRPILNFINKAFDDLAKSIGWLAGKIADWSASMSEESKAMQQLVVAQDNLEGKERVYTKNKAKREAEIARLREEANDAEEFTVAQRIEMLKKASALEEQNLKEGIKITEEKIRLAKEEAKANADTSDETANAIADLEAQLDEQRRNEANAQRALQKQLKALNREQTAALKSETDAQNAIVQERIDKMKEQEAEEQRISAEKLKTQTEIANQLKDAQIEAINDTYEKEKEKKQIAYERSIEQLRKQYADESQLTAQAKTDLNNLLLKLQENHNSEMDALENEHQARQQEELQSYLDVLKLQEEENDLAEEEKRYEKRQQELQETLDYLTEKGLLTQELQKQINDQLEANERQHTENIKKINSDFLNERRKSNAEAIKDAVSSMADMMLAFNEQSKAGAILQKSIAIGEVAVNTGKAIAAGVAQAQSVPFPANLSAIATTVATVLANIATATKTIKGAKFADGGIIGGNSFIGDNIGVVTTSGDRIAVNSGEMILNTSQQKQLFDIANGGRINGGLDYTALATAMANTPAPIMDYSEFTQFQGRTANYTELATI